MNDFIRDIASTISRERLLSPGEKVIVALSGGADSVALIVALHSLGYTCIAAHCDFHLRGDESERDRMFAERVASVFASECKVIHFDVEKYKRNHRVSTEMACRDLRYGWFAQLSAEYGGIPVAVAHHHDDNVETLLLNLLRGTGINGLSGMKYSNGIIIRPMLDLRRADIERFLNDSNIGFVTDSTNLVNDVKRNKIRNLILPMLRREFPDADKGLATSIRNLRSNAYLYEKLIQDASEKLVHDNGIISLEQLRKTSAEPATMLFEMVKGYGFNASQAADMVYSSGSGQSFVSKTHIAEIDRGLLSISAIDFACTNDASLPLDIDLNNPATLPAWLQLDIIGREQMQPDRSGNTLYLDASVLDSPLNFRLRNWQEGDRIAPFGMKGSRLLSDIFNDAKLTAAQRRSTRVLTCGDTILWVIGHRTSRHFPVTPATTRIIRVIYNP